MGWLRKVKEVARKLYEAWKRLGKPAPAWLLVLLVLPGCAPVTAGTAGGGPALSGLGALPPGQVARQTAVALAWRPSAPPPAPAAAQPDTMVVRSQWTVAASIDSVRVITVGYGREEVTYRRTGAGPLATSHEARFLLPEDAASVAGYAWACIITYRGLRSGGTAYGETETAEAHTPRPNCSPWTPFAWEFAAPLASGVTVTVERRP